jgi:hypothetical protein
MTQEMAVAGSHDLVIGGSGMLAGLCLKLAQDGPTVSIVARDARRIQVLAGQVSGRIAPAIADYRDLDTFAYALSRAVGDHGRAGRTFCWVHDEIAPEVPLQAADHVDGPFWHILGSGAANPAEPQTLSGWRERFRRRWPKLDYRQIVLGFVLEAERSRWLTDAEISDGVYSAAQSCDVLRIVGTIDPWSRRP